MMTPPVVCYVYFITKEEWGKVGGKTAAAEEHSRMRFALRKIQKRVKKPAFYGARFYRSNFIGV